MGFTLKEIQKLNAGDKTTFCMCQAFPDLHLIYSDSILQ